MFRLVMLLLCLPFLLSAESETPYHYTSQVKKGEGLHAFLRRYALNNACNINEFNRINNLTNKSKLLLGKKYKLPVMIHKYDGRSIRTSLKITEWNRAVKIKEYNEHIQKKGVRKTHYADSKILWVPYHLIECFTSDEIVEEKIKSGEKSPNTTTKAVETLDNSTLTTVNKTISLFGNEYQNFEEVDKSLKDKVFYIVSGHGGPDPGAVCENCKPTLCEDEYAYDVALRLARNLMQHGAKVEIIIQDANDGIRDQKYLKCDRDERCNKKKLPLNKKKRLQQRVVHINQLHKQYKKKGYKDHTVVVLHVDSAGKGARKDVFFYHHKTSKKGKRLANNIHNTFKHKYDKYQKGRGYKGTVKARGLYVVNYTNPPVVFIELANIQNKNDQSRILLSSNRQALANWLFEGLIAN